MTTTAPRSIDCPTCGETVDVGIPVSAENITLTTTPDTDLDRAVESEPRTRRLTFHCSEDHTIYTYFEW
jgi:hypothetical protein